MGSNSIPMVLTMLGWQETAFLWFGGGDIYVQLGTNSVFGIKKEVTREDEAFL